MAKQKNQFYINEVLAFISKRKRIAESRLISQSLNAHEKVLNLQSQISCSASNRFSTQIGRILWQIKRFVSPLMKTKLNFSFHNLEYLKNEWVSESFYASFSKNSRSKVVGGFYDYQ